MTLSSIRLMLVVCVILNHFIIKLQRNPRTILVFVSCLEPLEQNPVCNESVTPQVLAPASVRKEHYSECLWASVIVTVVPVHLSVSYELVSPVLRLSPYLRDSQLSKSSRDVHHPLIV